MNKYFRLKHMCATFPLSQVLHYVKTIDSQRQMLGLAVLLLHTFKFKN